MQTLHKPFLVMAIACLATGAMSNASASAEVATSWKPLQCTNAKKTELILNAPEVSANEKQGAAGMLEIGRLMAFMRRAGAPTVVPTAESHKLAMAKISRILQSGSFVGAKMALDEAAADVPGFKKTAFATDFAWFLRAM